jgi:hypothetical protein
LSTAKDQMDYTQSSLDSAKAQLAIAEEGGDEETI